MVLRGGDRRRQMTQAKFLQAGQKTFLLLAAKYPEHKFGGIGSSATGHHRQDETGEVGVIEVSDGAPSPPLRFLDALVQCAHVLARINSFRASLHQPSFRAPANPSIAARKSASRD